MSLCISALTGRKFWRWKSADEEALVERNWLGHRVSARHLIGGDWPTFRWRSEHSTEITYLPVRKGSSTFTLRQEPLSCG